MPNTRWLKVKHDLFISKTRTALVVLSIAVGVFGIGALLSSRETMAVNLARSYATINPTTAVIYTEPFEDELVRIVKNAPYVNNAEGRYTLGVRVMIGEDEWRNLRLHAISDFNAIRINKVKSDAGEWPPALGKVLLERTAVSFLDAGVGDILEIETSDRKRHHLPISGTAYDMFQVPSSWQGQADGYITFATLAQLGQARKYNELYFVTSAPVKTREQAREVAGDLRDDTIEPQGIDVFYTEVYDPGKHWFQDPMNTMMMLMMIIGLFTIILSGFQVVNTISGLLRQQVRQIGIMKAIGARTNQVIGMYLILVLAYGVLALIIAVPLGFAGGYGLAVFTAGMFNLDIKSFIVTKWMLLIDIGIAIVIPLLAAMYPVLATTRVSVREAISDYGIGETTYHGGLLDRLIEGARRVSRPVLMSFRNIFRHKWRMALTLTTLVLGGAILISVMSVRTSLLLTLEDIMRNFIYDVEINFEDAQRSGRVVRQVEDIPGVAAAESWSVRGAVRVRPDDTENESIIVIAPPAGSNLIKPKMMAGRWLKSGDTNAVVISSSFADAEKDVGIGSEITLKITGKESKWKVTGIATAQAMGSVVYVDYGYLSRTLKERGMARRVVVETTEHDPKTQIQVATMLERHFRRVGPSVSNIETNNGTRQRIGSQFDLLVIFLMIMALLLAVVGSLTLMGTMSLNVIERTKEIGVMRAIGADTGSVLKVVIVEGVFIGIISWVLAATLAIPLSRLLSYQVGVLFLKAPLSYIYSFDGAGIWLLASIMLGAIASVLPARRASQISVRDVLAYE